jgi:hypothetical protein
MMMIYKPEKKDKKNLEEEISNKESSKLSKIHKSKINYLIKLSKLSAKLLTKVQQ